MNQRKRRTYDHRIKAQIIAAGDPTLFPELQIPRSTAMSWIRRGAVEIVVIDEASHTEQRLRKRVTKLDHRVSMLTAVLRLVLALLRSSGFKLEQTRVGDAEAKCRLLAPLSVYEGSCRWPLPFAFSGCRLLDTMTGLVGNRDAPWTMSPAAHDQSPNA